MPFRITMLLSFTIGLLVATPLVAAETRSDRVLMVVSSHGQDEGGTRPGFEMDELSQAYAVFADNGLKIDIASPSGGAVVADKFDAAKPYNKRFLEDPSAKSKLNSTLALANIHRDQYGAVFIIGGKGAMFDLTVNADLKTLLAETHHTGGVIGAVCHGPAALINVPLKNGTSLADGRAMTGFSNEEEALFGKRWAASFPVLLESGLRGAGAKFSEAPMMLSHVVTDGKLVTGQNPYSTSDAAEAVVKVMGRPLAPRQPWADERSIALIGQLLTAEKEKARASLSANPSQYDVPLLAMWGFYRAQSAGSDRAALAHAIEVMEIAAPHFKEPRLAAAIAEGRSKIAKMQ